MTIHPGQAADLGSDQPYQPKQRTGGLQAGWGCHAYLMGWDFTEIAIQGVPTTIGNGMGHDDIQRVYPCQDTTDLPGYAV